MSLMKHIWWFVPVAGLPGETVCGQQAQVADVATERTTRVALSDPLSNAELTAASPTGRLWQRLASSSEIDAHMPHTAAVP